MFPASHGVSAKKSQNDIFEIAFSVNTREREIISVHCNKKAVSMMRRAFLLLVLFFCAGSFGSAQLPSSNSGSTSDDCLTNPMSGACASQNSSQTQSSQTAGQSTLSGNPTPVDLGVSGSRQSMASPDLKSGAGDLGQPPDDNQPDQKEQADQIQRQMRSKAQLSPSSPEAENEFQNFVEISIGKKLALFGYELFRNAPSTFAPTERIPITGNYLVGPGDELLISVWGQVTLTARMTVDREGNIDIPRVGPVNVAGVKYSDLHDKLASALARYYKQFQLSVSLGRLRSIQIFVTGFARQPGNYTVSSLTTLVDALFASGGPSPQGSMRAIQLKRGGQVISEFDMYDFLLGGDNSKDVALQAEDVIYIPAVGPLVAMAGAVQVPAIYELAKGSTLGGELAVAGGLSTVADGNRVTIERIDKRSSRSVEEVSLDAQAMSMPLRDGDIVRVVTLSPRIENAVILRGNVALPGRYPFRPGMHVKDLIPNREFLLTPDFWKAQTAVRERNQIGRASCRERV